jgi:hypothetical protein
MAEKAGFEGEGEVEFRSPGKIRDARDEGFQETCRTSQDSNKTPKRRAMDNEICVRPQPPGKTPPFHGRGCTFTREYNIVPSLCSAGALRPSTRHASRPAIPT